MTWVVHREIKQMEIYVAILSNDGGFRITVMQLWYQKLLTRNAAAFSLSQRIIPFTVWEYQRLLRLNVAVSPKQSVLDIGCGTGAYCGFFSGQYFGIDDNPLYMGLASREHEKGKFVVMSGSRLAFTQNTFDHVLIIAAIHHMDDEVVGQTIVEAFRVLRNSGRVHVVDPVQPVLRRSIFKKFLLARDRGCYPRSLSQLTLLVSSTSRIEKVDLRCGVLHDVCYLRLAPL